jgi:hypothetical protein
MAQIAQTIFIQSQIDGKTDVFIPPTRLLVRG